MTASKILLRESARPLTVRFSPRGNILAAGLDDGTLQLWVVESFARPLGRVVTPDAVGDILFSPRLSMLITRGTEHLRGWRIPDLGAAFEVHVGPIEAAVFLPEGNHMVVAVGGRLRTIDLRDRSTTLETPPLGRAIAQLALDSGRQGLVALCDNDVASTLRVLDLANLRESHTVELAYPARTFSLSPSGDHAALANGRVRVVDFPGGVEKFVATGTVVSALNGHSHRGWTRPIFSAEGRLLLAGSPDGRIPLWDTARGAEVRVFEGHEGPLSDIDLWHGRARLASCGSDNTVRIWDLKQPRR